MKKVCHLTSVHSRKDVRIFEKECISLANNGYDITLVVCDNQPDEVKGNVKIISTGFKGKTRFQRMLQSGKYILNKAIEIDADIYHFHDPELLIVGYKLKKKYKKSVIFDSHEYYFEQILNKPYFNGVMRNVIAKLYSFTETFICRNLDAVIVPCTFDGMDIFKGRSKETVFINNAPRKDELFERYDASRQKAGNSACYIGGLTYERGIYHTVLACARANIKLILAGRFTPDSFKEKIASLPEYKNVEYRGEVSRDEIFKILNETSIGMCLILNIGQYGMIENLPTKVYEYMSMGIPVIISDTKYNRSTIEKYQYGICVDPENTEEIASAIQYILTHPEEAEKMGKNGRDAVERELNWKIEEAKLLKLYAKL